MRLPNLGYAVTAHQAQGVTTDTAHAIVTPRTNRENLYVAMTGGRQSNHAWIAVTQTDHHRGAHPADMEPPTPRQILEAALRNSGADASAQ